VGTGRGDCGAMMPDAYVGIDVAVAKGKRLPVCVTVQQPGGTLAALPLRVGAARPPAGQGNRAALDSRRRDQFAHQVLRWLQGVERCEGIRIRRIAIDASSDYCAPGASRRAAETALDGEGISVFATPTRSQFHAKQRAARAYLAAGHPESGIPSANQLWMLVGFALFRVLGTAYECLETYPQAVARSLGVGATHKSTAAGLAEQVAALAARLGQRPEELVVSLRTQGYGSGHDRLDARLCAWVASLEAGQRRALGRPPRDAIWVPAPARTPRAGAPSGG